MHGSKSCRIEPRPQGRVLEFVCFGGSTPDSIAAVWPTAPGGVRRDGAQRAELLHFAPGRWLAPEPGAEVDALLDAAVRAGAGTMIDASGKWECLALTGPGATRLLASAIAIDAVLAGRGCAALSLFDCPAIITREAENFVLWVQSSYAADFMATAGRLQAVLEPQG